MPDDERGFTLIEMTIAVAIVAMLAAAAGLWAMSLRPAGLRSALDQYDGALAAARALAQTSGNGATLAFEPDAHTGGFLLRVYRGRPTSPGAVSPTPIAAAGEGIALRERSLGAPPFAIFVGTAGHVGGLAGYPALDGNGRPVFSEVAREPSCPAGGFSFTFSTAYGARVRRDIPCAQVAYEAPVPEPTPTPNTPLLTPSRLVFAWPGAPSQRVAATEWGYTNWFASADGFACAGGVAGFPDVLPAPFTPPWTQAQADATPPPPPATPFSYPNSLGGSTNDAPAFFPVLPQDAGLCRLEVVDAFGRGAGAQAQVMGAIALQNVDGSPAEPVDLLLAQRSPVVVYAAKTYDSQIVVPVATGCVGIVRTRAGQGVAPARPGLAPARTPVELRAAGAGICTLSIRSQYPGEPPALLGLRVRGALAIDPPAILLPPGATTLAVPAASEACYARAFTDATFATPDTRDSALSAGTAAGTIAYDAATGCYTSANRIAALVTEPGLTAPDRFASDASDCTTLVTPRWNPPGASPPAAWLALDRTPQAGGACTLHVSDSTPRAQAANLALKVSTGCPDAGNSRTGPLDGRCYDLYDLTVTSEATATWTTAGIEAFYVPHGTPGSAFLSWSLNDPGGCTLAMNGATVFAQWGIVLSYGGPTPPPVGVVGIANGAGFTPADTAEARPALAVAPPEPKTGGSPLGPCHVLPSPPPGSGGN